MPSTLGEYWDFILFLVILFEMLIKVQMHGEFAAWRTACCNISFISIHTFLFRVCATAKRPLQHEADQVSGVYPLPPLGFVSLAIICNQYLCIVCVCVCVWCVFVHVCDRMWTSVLKSAYSVPLYYVYF